MAPSPRDKLPQSHYLAIGRLAVAASEIDSLLSDLIAAFTDTRDIRHIVITVHHQQPSSKADSLLALIRLELGDRKEFEPLIKLVEQAKSLCDYRNTILHAYWKVREDGEIERLKFSARGRLKRSRERQSSEEIQERSDEAFALAAKLAALRDRVWESRAKSDQSP